MSSGKSQHKNNAHIQNIHTPTYHTPTHKPKHSAYIHKEVHTQTVAFYKAATAAASVLHN